MVFGTEVHVMRSGEPWKVTCVVSVPVLENVIRQLTDGVFPERFDTPVQVVSSPVKVWVNEISWFCAASGRPRAAQSSNRGMALRNMVMP
jgi:hypothetical protein